MDNNLRKRQWQFTLIYLVWVVIAIWFLRSFFAAPEPRELAYSDFIQQIREDHLAKVKITDRQVVGELKPGVKLPPAGKTQTRVQANQISATRIPGYDTPDLIKLLQDHGVKFSGEIPETNWWTTLLASWGPLFLLLVIYIYAMSRMTRGAGGALSFGRNKAKIHDESTRHETRFSDVAGVEEAKAELWEIIDFLRNPRKYQRLGGRIPKGVLLVGPPGTGKTLLARAAAGEAGVPFFSISGSEFVEMFVGVGAARVRDLFESAKQKAPCIIFIDELDAIGKSRSSGRTVFGNDEREQTLNQLLVEMDGFDSSRGVIIMAATNTPDVLDPALMRPGRFDRQVILDRPDLKEREAILRVHARKLQVAPNVDLEAIAAQTPGMVGADLANIVNEAALMAARRDAESIEMQDFEHAVDRVLLGFEKKGRLISAEEKERVAYHEAGHALVAITVPHGDPVRRVSIIPRSVGSLGHTLQLPTQDKYLLTEPELDDRISVMLGGRAAEEIVYNGVVSTGASDDLQRASELARQMVTRFGMSARLGNVTWGVNSSFKYLSNPFGGDERNYSERTAEEIDDEVRTLIDKLYAGAKQILTQRRQDLENIVAGLKQKETLDHDELERVLSQPLPDPAPEPAMTD